ncbi:Integrase catalytic region, partial [Candidatus Magnetomorum sp. HK-1]
TYSDIQLNKKYFRVDKKFRGDRVEVRYDIFSHVEIIEVYSLRGEYLGKGYLHNREEGEKAESQEKSGIPEHDYLELLVRQHKKAIDSQTKGIDYREVVNGRPWPFHSFANTFASLLGRKGGITGFTSEELEKLKKTYNQSLSINKEMLLEAFELSDIKTLPYIIHELKLLIKKKGE